MDQNTEAWHKFRANSIGASEISIIMGVSPYKKRSELLQEKAFPKIEDNKDKEFIFAKGHRYEIKIRNFVEFDTGLSFPHQPTVIFSHRDYSTPIHASLDGKTEDSTVILEAKFVGFEKFNEYRLTKIKYEHGFTGTPPIHYMWQIQQQLLITGAKKCIFAFCRETKSGDLEYDYFDVLPDIGMQEQVLIEAKKFWDEVLELRHNGQPDYSELDKLIESYHHNVHAMELLEAAQSALKTKIFSIAGKDKIDRSGYSVQTVISKGRETVDYKKFVEDSEITVPEAYKKTGAPSESQRITFKTKKDK